MLNDEWEKCSACELGDRRRSIDGKFVPGEGVRRGIMFIGEGPGREESIHGRPFSGESGKLLRRILSKLNFEDYYLTHLVGCRACEPVIDPTTGLPQMRKRRGLPDEVYFRDQVPLPTQIEKCQARLHEEIYLVDPVLIVTLGAPTSSAVLGHPVPFSYKPSNPEQCVIPGASLRPVLTAKKQAWGRSIHGTFQLPTEINEVRYLVLPTFHPAFVNRKINDQGLNNPLQKFGADIRLAIKIYERYLVEALGTEPTSTSDVDLSDVGGENGDE